MDRSLPTLAKLARRASFGLLTAFLVAGAATTPVQAQADKKLSIKVAAYQNPNLNIWGPLVAQELGLYAKYGLDADVKVTKPSNIMPMLLSGAIDVACPGGAGVVLDAIIQGQDLQVVLGEGSILPYTLVSRSIYKKISDLKGKILSTPSIVSGTSYAVLVETLKKNGIQPNEVQWVELADSPTRARTLIAGRIDATVLTQDETLLVQGRPEIHTLAETPGNNTAMKPFMYCVATRAYIAGHGEELTRWAKAMIETHRRLNADEKAYVDLVKKIKEDQYSTKDAEQLYELAKKTGYWSVNGGMEPTWYRETLDYFMTIRKDAKTQPKIEAFYNDKFVRAALDQIGKVPSATDPADWYTKK